MLIIDGDDEVLFPPQAHTQTHISYFSHEQEQLISESVYALYRLVVLRSWSWRLRPLLTSTYRNIWYRASVAHIYIYFFFSAIFFRPPSLGVLALTFALPRTLNNLGGPRHSVVEGRHTGARTAWEQLDECLW